MNSNRKRKLNNNGWQNAKKQKQNNEPAAKNLNDRIAEAKRKAQEKIDSARKSTEQPRNYEKNNKGEPVLGLRSAKIHPLLREIKSVEDRQPNTEKKPEVVNPLLQQKLQPGVSRTALNPYFDPASIKSDERKRKRKALVFNEKGKYIAQAERLREKQELAKIEQEEAQKITELGLDPDEAIRESAYKKPYPPRVEWWDEALFYKGKTYENIDDTKAQVQDNSEALVLANEEETPITSYIQHPVPINAPWEKHLPPPKPMFLTKKELKRIRKNRRAEQHKEKQDRIRLGLDAAPPPKVKLSNLMNVLTNEAIRDPTAVEMRVRQEVEERRLRHLAENEARKLTAEQKHEKVEKKWEKNVAEKGIFSAVFRIDKLVSNQHIFKVDINAKQHKLSGVCLINNTDFSLVIVEGPVNSINKYKHLLLDRINWQQYPAPKTLPENAGDGDSDGDINVRSNSTTPSFSTQGIIEKLAGNQCRLVWEGQLLEFHFQKWSTHKVSTDADAVQLLKRYKADHYWLEAKVLDD